MNNFIFKLNNTRRNNNSRIVYSNQNPIINNHSGKKYNPEAEISKARAWGVITWMLFHTLAEKIKNNYFTSYIHTILIFIQKICNCLPCPYCREDAKKYLSSFNFSLIKSKMDLKLFIYDFHNNVNKKLGNENSPIKILEKYENLDIINVINLWSQYFTRYGIEAQEFMEGMQRNSVKNELYNFIIKNRHIFN